MGGRLQPFIDQLIVCIVTIEDIGIGAAKCFADLHQAIAVIPVISRIVTTAVLRIKGKGRMN